jgi:hypothetical protein
MIKPGSKVGIMAIATAGVFLAATTVAVAAIPAHNGTIHGCYAKKTFDLRVVKSAKDCTRSEKALSWKAKAQRGARGSQGPRGVPGSPGTPGTPAVAGYAEAYNLAAEVVPVESPVTFDSNGPSSGIVTHSPGSATLTVVSAGTYLVDFSVSAVEPGQFTLFVNGAAAPGTTYGSGAGTQQDTGQAILTLAAGDAVTLVNHTSAAAVTLESLAGGTVANVNASMVVERLA